VKQNRGGGVHSSMVVQPQNDTSLSKDKESLFKANKVIFKKNTVTSNPYGNQTKLNIKTASSTTTSKSTL